MSHAQWTSLLMLGLVTSLAVACERVEPVDSGATLYEVDSVLAELGGQQTAGLERGQRWRMISSIGSGLPPSNFDPENLPQPRSRSASLLKAYCVQCHWVPAPQMHTAEEWPFLMRSMLLRARTLRDRMGGPTTSGLVGEILMSGMSTAELPSPENVDSLLAYLQANALPAIDPNELVDGPGVTLFVQKCSICHATPSPKAHTRAAWQSVVARMVANMSLMDIEPLTSAQADSITAYLRSNAAADS